MMVRENIDFVRGKDPKKSLEIGHGRKLRPKFKKDWKNYPEGFYIVKMDEDTLSRIYQMLYWIPRLHPCFSLSP